MYTKNSATNLMNAMEAMNQRLQERRLREKLSQDRMEELTKEYELKSRASEDEYARSSLKEDAKFERELGYGTRYVYDDIGNRIGEKKVPVAELGGAGGTTTPPPPAEDEFTSLLGAGASAGGAGVAAPEAVEGRAGMIGKTPVTQFGESMSELVKPISNLSNPITNPAGAVIGGPVAGLMRGYDEATGFGGRRATNQNAESDIEAAVLAKMTPEQIAAYRAALSGERSAQPAQAAPLETEQERLRREQEAEDYKMKMILDRANTV